MISNNLRISYTIDKSKLFSTLKMCDKQIEYNTQFR